MQGAGGDKQSAAAIGGLLDAWFPAFMAILEQPTTAHVHYPPSLTLFTSPQLLARGLDCAALGRSCKALKLHAGSKAMCCMVTQRSCAGAAGPSYESAGGLPEQDVADWGLKLEVLRLLVALTVNWRRVAQRHMPGLLQRCWGQFTACAALYEAAVVRADQDLDEGEARPPAQHFLALSVVSFLVHLEPPYCTCEALRSLVERGAEVSCAAASGSQLARERMQLRRRHAARHPLTQGRLRMRHCSACRQGL